MRFTPFFAITLAAVANGVAVQQGANAGSGDGLTAIKACNVGHNYCGWYLADSLHWQGVPNRNGLYYCSSKYAADYVTYCSKGCKGPTAHCG
ncbi:hypothetical protein MGYG_01623 [Nannizzia gypsea CBS 118893]|uniref:Uncharacterized protein n=1 Tax=Arthroderma gypseum (strain ATCC MYA-4604 / CBS 118893) TaxID=535722 RepID=E5R235_ARTGP|nr:hypothetical protein MGYG_01623 [Nannizzia gypsea CBS 118893]EFQ98599.1 hypothetical protein MGYG_01623 [Nannizzia gypsea CBS 118893]